MIVERADVLRLQLVKPSIAVCNSASERALSAAKRASATAFSSGIAGSAEPCAGCARAGWRSEGAALRDGATRAGAYAGEASVRATCRAAFSA